MKFKIPLLALLRRKILMRRYCGLLLVAGSIFLWSGYRSIPIQEVHGLYVNDFKNIIGKPHEEEELLKFAQKEGFNYLLLYNLSYIHKNLFDLTDPESSQALARFIKKAKTKYGILEVGAVGETAKSFAVIHRYNEMYRGSVYFGIDVYNIEFEFWNKKLVEEYYCPEYFVDGAIPCSTETAFNYYLAQLLAVRKMAKEFNLKMETYIGKPTRPQCTEIGRVCDRVLVHYYRTSDVYKNGHSIYRYKDYRLSALAPKEGVLKVLPIFSARPNHMGPWLEDHPKTQAYQTFHHGPKGFGEEKGEWKKHILIQGAQWYRYTDLLKIRE